MEFRKMVMITLYARQQKRHRCIEQSFGLCGTGSGWDDLGEWHWNMYIIILKQIASPGLLHDTGWSGLVHWGDPEGWCGEAGGKGFRMGNTCTLMADSSQCMAKPIQYCKVKLKKKKKRVLEWVAISSSRGSSWHMIKPESPALAGRFFTTEPPGKSDIYIWILILISMTVRVTKNTQIACLLWPNKFYNDDIKKKKIPVH